MFKLYLTSILVAEVVALAALAFPGVASAQSGHFITGGGNAPSCTDEGTTVECTGKVAGLGGTTRSRSRPGHRECRVQKPGWERRARSGHERDRGRDGRPTADAEERRVQVRF